MSGTGSLTKAGAGNLTLTGANNYTGGTTVNAGTLTGNTASLSGNLTNNAGVVFDQATTGTHAGTMSGTSSPNPAGAKTISHSLTGASNYTGGTTVNAGTLTGNTTSLTGNLTNNAGVVFDQATTGTYAGTMSGTGSLTKAGAGNLTLTGTNTYAGGTCQRRQPSAGSAITSAPAAHHHQLGGTLAGSASLRLDPDRHGG